MDKEKLITIAIGLAVGVAIAGLYFAAVKFVPNLGKTPPTITFNPPPPAPAAKSLIVNQPVDETTTKDSPITISGQAAPAAQIIVFAPAEEKIASADAAGNFSTTLKLEDGENEISVSLFSRETIKRHVILEISQWKKVSL